MVGLIAAATVLASFLAAADGANNFTMTSVAEHAAADIAGVGQLLSSINSAVVNGTSFPISPPYTDAFNASVLAMEIYLSGLQSAVTPRLYAATYPGMPAAAAARANLTRIDGSKAWIWTQTSPPQPHSPASQPPFFPRPLRRCATPARGPSATPASSPAAPACGAPTSACSGAARTTAATGSCGWTPAPRPGGGRGPRSWPPGLATRRCCRR